MMGYLNNKSYLNALKKTTNVCATMNSSKTYAEKMQICLAGNPP